MRRVSCIMGVSLLVAGCATPEEDRAHAATEHGLHLYQQRNSPAAQQKFQAARVTDAGAPLGPGAFGALLCRLGSSGLNRSISWY